MPYSVRVTLVAFKGDPEHYPCHAKLKIGDTLTFDGAELKGKMCPHMLLDLASAIKTLFVVGPRYINPGFYNHFWYSCNSVPDPSKECFDGNGWRPINKMYETPPYHVACLQDPGAFNWPPKKTRDVAKNVSILCPDTRTGALFRAEAFDLATAGSELPYVRREITIMDRINKTCMAYPVDKIMELYTESELYEIYPPLSPVIIEGMLSELESLGFVTLSEGNVIVTESGAARVARYKTEIPSEHVKALGL